MPVVPNATIDAITSARDRAKLEDLLKERAFRKYAFSLTKMIEAAEDFGIRVPDLMELLVRSTISDEEKEIKKYYEDINDKVAGILAKYDLTGIEETDFLGNRRVFVVQPGKSVTFNNKQAMTLLLQKLSNVKGIAKTLEKVWAECTKESPYVTLQCRSGKEVAD